MTARRLHIVHTDADEPIGYVPADYEGTVAHDFDQLHETVAALKAELLHKFSVALYKGICVVESISRRVRP